MLLSRLDEGRAVAVESPAGPGRASVADQLDLLLGEHLLPLRTRRTTDEPHLLAVDASGQPVVVEVAGLLDAQVCLRALRHAGAAARMSSADIAAAYRGGAAQFPSHFEAFRRSVPASSRLSTQVRSGARLMLVCTEVDPDLDEVLEFLLQPGWQVEVLCVRVTRDATGAKVAEVVPVERSVPDRRPAPAGVRGPAGSLPRRQPPVVLAEPAVDAGSSTETAPTVTPPTGTVTAGSRRARRSEGSRAVVPTVVPPSFAVVRTPEVVAPPAVDPDVADLASRMGGPVTLVWELAPGTYREALLRVDGRVELPDGAVVDTVGAAAERLGGGAVHDARSIWRIGDHRGPTLAELLT